MSSMTDQPNSPSIQQSTFEKRFDFYQYPTWFQGNDHLIFQFFAFSQETVSKVTRKVPLLTP